MKNYQPVIGLEVHIQLKTKRKMFCDCPADSFGKKPNSQVCPVCLGLPGAIPSPPNKEAIKKAVRVAKALKCKIGKEGRFERKHYFYPDLPKGFQISQLKSAIGVKGEFSAGGGQGGIRITRVHLEEDAGKLVHEKAGSLVDLNRAGVPLLEIVTEPDVESAAQAKSILKELQTVLRHLKVSDADMEKGSLRLEANVSLRECGSRKPEAGSKSKKAVTKRELPDYKVELKNINSFNFLAKALEVEITRQEKILKAGEKVVQETRGYDAKENKTYSQRIKEEASDYRYFPEPDLPPITSKSLVCEGQVDLPHEKRSRLKDKYKLSKQYVDVLTSDTELLEIFEEGVQKDKGINPKELANAIVNRRYGDPKKLGAAGLVKVMKATEKKEEAPVAEAEAFVEKVILDNERAVADYRSGKETALQFLVGAVMRKAKGKVDPNKARELLKKKLQGG